MALPCILCRAAFQWHAEVGAAVPEGADLSDALRHLAVPGLLEWQFVAGGPDMVVPLIAAGAAWLPDASEQSVALTNFMSSRQWVEPYMVSSNSRLSGVPGVDVPVDPLGLCNLHHLQAS
jgi:hypothetical protein